MTDHVYDPDYANAVYVESNDDGTLELTVTTEVDAIALTLDARGIRALRLILQRHERRAN